RGLVLLQAAFSGQPASVVSGGLSVPRHDDPQGHP
ncbi:hypothetical protein ATR1_080d0001, partial [Acetobacter tropicalis]